MEFFLLHFFFGGRPDGRVVGLVELDHVPGNPGQFMGHGGDGFGGAQSRLPPSEAIAHVIFGTPQTLRGQAQGFGAPAFDLAGFAAQDFAPGDAVVGTQPQPGAEMFGGGETLDEVGSQFGEQNQCGVDLHAGNLGEIHAAEPVQFGAGVELGLVALRLSVRGGGGGQGLRRRFALESAEVAFNLLVTLRDELLVMFPGVQRLLQDEEVFSAPVALQAAGDGVAAGFDAMVFQGGKLLRVAFAGENGFEDEQAGDAGQVADDVLNLEVHLRERLVQMADMVGGVTDERVAMAQERTHRADRFGRAEAGTQQADGVEILQPLAIGDVGLFAGNIFGVAGVDQADFDLRGFEDLKEWNPIDAGRFHRDGSDATLFKPITDEQKVIGEGGEGADGSGVGIERDGDLDLRGADVDAASVRMEGGELGVNFCCHFFADGHKVPFVDVSDGRAAPGVLEQVSSLLIGMNDRRANAKRSHQ